MGSLRVCAAGTEVCRACPDTEPPRRRSGTGAVLCRGAYLTVKFTVVEPDFGTVTFLALVMSFPPYQPSTY